MLTGKSAWPTVRLGDVVLRSRNQVDPRVAHVDRYVAGGHIDSDSILIERWGVVNDGDLGSTFRYTFNPAHVLFVSARPYLRKTGVAQFSGVVADKTYVLEPRDDTVLSSAFLPLVLKSDHFVAFATRAATGSINPRILWGPFQQYEFALPPRDAQERIASLFWSLEQHHASMSRVRREVGLAQSALLVHRLSVGAEGLGWRRLQVPSIVQAGPSNGKSLPASESEQGVPTIALSAVRDGRIDPTNSVKRIDIDPALVRSYLLAAEDVLIVRGNGNRALTGRAGLVTDNIPAGCIYPDLLMRIRLDRSVMHPKFAVLQWNSGPSQAALDMKAKSTNGIWKINGADVRSHSLIAPPLVDQEAIMRELSTFDRSIESIDRELSSISEMRTRLLVDVFGGPV